MVLNHGSNIPNVKTLIYPNTITKVIGDKGDYNHILEKVVLPSNLKEIGEQAFYECKNLNNIEISSSVTSIGKRAFYCCYSLTSIEIPSSVTSIGSDAFSACYSLTTVNYGGTMAQWQQVTGKDELSGYQIICTDGTIN